MRLDARPCCPLVKPVVLGEAFVWRVGRSAATRNRMSARPFGKTRQTWGSRSPMRWATARMVSSSSPISGRPLTPPLSVAGGVCSLGCLRGECSAG